MTHVCLFVEKPLGNFDRDRFCLVFKAQLSGAKFYVVAELRAPTTDLCDLGLSVDPGTVFVSLYFAQVLRELFVFQVWPTQLEAAVRVRYRHSVERGKEVPLVRLRLRNSNSLHKDLNVSG